MLYRDFFKLVIKVVGFMCFIKTIYQMLPIIISYSEMEKGGVISVFSFVILCLLVLYFMIKFPSKIVDFFGLDKGFQNESLGIKKLAPKDIILLSAVIIGGFLVVNNIAKLLPMLYVLRTMDKSFFLDGNMEQWSFIINLILGFCLIIFRKNIANYFEK